MFIEQLRRCFVIFVDFQRAWTQNIAQSVEKVSLLMLRRAPIAVTLQFMKQFTRRQSVVLNIISAFKMGSSVEVNENCS